jgi:hypothetical protein
VVLLAAALAAAAPRPTVAVGLVVAAAVRPEVRLLALVEVVHLAEVVNPAVRREVEPQLDVEAR